MWYFTGWGCCSPNIGELPNGDKNTTDKTARNSLLPKSTYHEIQAFLGWDA